MREVLRAADPDPYRDAVRDAVLGKHVAKMVELASRKQTADQLPGFVTFLGEDLAIPVERPTRTPEKRSAPV